ncbi:hypothetical protein Pmani_020279 [Petrolisthes manimaculis]|uniref:Sushi domain-containing protein n=1 Tax=Petrolisthes manimaculis TaxID=1843537 RepID=A0AAE1PGK3_9EUCA|nr:hypothetical protein Pmani_020279 [Petrolisthes manimaculis]
MASTLAYPQTLSDLQFISDLTMEHADYPMDGGKDILIGLNDKFGDFTADNTYNPDAELLNVVGDSEAGTKNYRVIRESSTGNPILIPETIVTASENVAFAVCQLHGRQGCWSTPPVIPANAYSAVDTTAPPIPYTCYPGYFAGNLTEQEVECVGSLGGWLRVDDPTLLVVECLPKDVCMEFPESPSALLTEVNSTDHLHLNGTTTFTCPANMVTSALNDTQIFTCTETDPTVPEYAFVPDVVEDCNVCLGDPEVELATTDRDPSTNYTIDQSVIVTCDSGYEVTFGVTTYDIMCNNTGWNTSQTCHKDCQDTPVLINSNSDHTPTNHYKEGDIITQTCTEGYNMDLDITDENITCTAEGWTPDPPTPCYRATSDPPPYDNTTMVLSGMDGPYAPNSVQLLTCAPRTISFTGEDSTEVTYDGTNWIKADPAFDCFHNDVLSSTKLQVIKLRHPCTDTSAMFMFDKDNAKLYEFYAFDEGHRSWFLGETVQCDGKLYVTTPVDVTYLVLPYLTNNKVTTVSVPLDHLLDDPEFPAISCLAAVAAKRDFSHIADRKGNPELGVWKYNEEKTVGWLAGRTEKLASLLQDRKVPTSSAQSFTYVRTMSLDETKEAYLELSYGILCDYLSDTLSKALRQHLQLPEVRVKKKAPSGVENQAPPKKRKSEGPLDDYSKDGLPASKGNTPQNAKARALARSASGSKSITSFFTKK